MHFFVEFRFYGYPNSYLKSLIHEVARTFRVKGRTKSRPVPHMTLYGPSETRDIRGVFAAIENVAKRYALVPFKIDGFECRDGTEGKVIACRIDASTKLASLRRELAGELSKVSKPNHWDRQHSYWFHSTIAFRDVDPKFDDIRQFLERGRQPQFEQYLTRITILGKGGHITREYDLILQKWLSRTQVLLNRWYWRRKTEDKLKKLQGLSPNRRRSLWRALSDFIGKAHSRNGGALMSGVKYRRRGTAVVETERGILLTAGRIGKPFMLPGGGAKKGESRFMAALREMTEETGLLPYAAEIIFTHKGKIRPTKSGRHSFQDQHTVCFVKASGSPRPGGGDAKRIAYYSPGCNVWISTTTEEIIERYYQWKNRQQSEESKTKDEDDSVEDIENEEVEDEFE